MDASTRLAVAAGVTAIAAAVAAMYLRRAPEAIAAERSTVVAACDDAADAARAKRPTSAPLPQAPPQAAPPQQPPQGPAPPVTPPAPKAAASVTREEEDEDGEEDEHQAGDDADSSNPATAAGSTSPQEQLEWSLALQYPTPEPPGADTPDLQEHPEGEQHHHQQQQQRPPHPTTTAPRRPAPPPLASLCARLCERHCAKLWDFNGEDGGEPAALDAACGAGGATFALADVGFASVLGVDGAQAHVLAAKELRESGELAYACAATGRSTVARVPEGVDRDRVRFWHFAAWPGALPPKLQPVDCVLVADAGGAAAAAARVPRGGVASLVSQAAPGLLTPGGVLVVVLAGAAATEEEEVEEGRGATATAATTAAARPRLFSNQKTTADPRWRSEVAPALASALEDGELEVACEHARLDYALGAAATAGGASPLGAASAVVFRRRGGRRPPLI